MSVASPLARGQFTITALPQQLSIFAFNYDNGVPDLLVTDGANVLTLNSDYTVVGGGYNGTNQLTGGYINILAGGDNNVQFGDVITVSRNVPLTQTTTFSSTGLQTPLMIEQDDDKLTTIAQQQQGQQYNPFPPVFGTANEIELGWIAALSGGTRTSIDSLNVTNIPPYQLPLFIGVSIADIYTKWKLRPMQMGDPSVTTLPNYIVPVTNPNNLIWVSQ